MVCGLPMINSLIKNDYVKKFSVLAIMVLLASCVFGEAESKEYVLNYLVGATGYNLYIKDENGEVKYFYFDKNRSSRQSLDAWDKLKWNVAYPNSKGKIRIIGFLDEKGKVFVLRKWALESPFTVWYDKHPDELSSDYVINTETRLTCEHFEGKCPKNLDDLVFTR